ncbi:MAG: hypothetical protein WD845_06850, partial [Pirellulales bacterium]
MSFVFLVILVVHEIVSSWRGVVVVGEFVFKKTAPLRLRAAVPGRNTLKKVLCAVVPFLGAVADSC